MSPTIRDNWLWSMIVAGVLASTAGAQDVKCTATVEVACGELSKKLSPLTEVKGGTCLFFEVGSVGKEPPGGVKQKAYIWVGVSVSGDTLVFGKGEAKSGLLVECVWEAGQPKPEKQMDSFKASLPDLLKSDKLQKEFPGIKKIDVSALTEAGKPKKEQIDAAKELLKK